MSGERHPGGDTVEKRPCVGTWLTLSDSLTSVKNSLTGNSCVACFLRAGWELSLSEEMEVLGGIMMLPGIGSVGEIVTGSEGKESEVKLLWDDKMEVREEL